MIGFIFAIFANNPPHLTRLLPIAYNRRICNRLCLAIIAVYGFILIGFIVGSIIYRCGILGKLRNRLGDGASFEDGFLAIDSFINSISPDLLAIIFIVLFI